MLSLYLRGSQERRFPTGFPWFPLAAPLVACLSLPVVWKKVRVQITEHVGSLRSNLRKKLDRLWSGPGATETDGVKGLTGRFSSWGVNSFGNDSSSPELFPAAYVLFKDVHVLG